MATNENQILQIRLEIPKESYSIGEPIDVIVALNNRSNAPVTINKRMGVNPAEMSKGHWELRFDITYPAGTPPFPRPRVNRGNPKAEDFTLLSPGAEMTFSITLSSWHWLQFPGAYEVRAIYSNAVDGSQFGLSAWTGDITSNSVSFKVSE